jgi:hypothetical protein
MFCKVHVMTTSMSLKYGGGMKGILLIGKNLEEIVSKSKKYFGTCLERLNKARKP